MEAFVWPNGAEAAVSLSYDGGLPEQLHLAQPLLRILRLRATFYLSATFLLENPRAWANVLMQEHEIGNHSLFGVTGPRGELPNWTLEMVEADLQDTQTLLDDYLPSDLSRSFAYPGDLPVCSEGTYESVVERQFEFTRSAQAGINHPVFCNPRKLLSTRCEGKSGIAVIQKVEETAELGAWIILAVEGIGSSRKAFDEHAHEMLLRHLAENVKRFYIAPVSEVAQTVVNLRKDVLRS